MEARDGAEKVEEPMKKKESIPTEKRRERRDKKEETRALREEVSREASSIFSINPERPLGLVKKEERSETTEERTRAPLGLVAPRPRPRAGW